MRTPNDETRGVIQEGDDAAGGDDPIRRCILSGERASRAGLVRLVLAPDGLVWPDLRAKAPGRGAWIGVPRAEFEKALAKGKLKGALARAFKTSDFAIPTDLPERIERGLEQAFRDRLGLEAKAGALVIGGERIERAAREGRLALLLHASDAGADGRRRLDQAWRVGSEKEGSDLKGLVLPVARPILSMALGRENVVSLGINDPGAARRLRAALDRWLHFIGSPPVSPACETASQGAPAVTHSAHD